MNATVEIQVPAAEVPPTDQAKRIAWLERFGKPADGVTCVTATLREWSAVGADIDPAGNVVIAGGWPTDRSQLAHGVMSSLRDAALQIAHETGSLPATLPEAIRAEVFRAQLAQYEQQQAAIAASNAKREQEAERVQREQEAERDRVLALVLAVEPHVCAAGIVGGEWSKQATELLEAAIGETLPSSVHYSDRWTAYRQRVEAAVNATNAEAFDRLLGELLSAEQLERYRAGVLPTEERDRVVRDYLFAGLEQFSIYSPIHPEVLDHDDDCEVDHVKVKVASSELPEMTADEYARYKSLVAAWSDRVGPTGEPIAVEREPRKHYTTCTCEQNGHVKFGLRIKQITCGRSFAREFELA